MALDYRTACANIENLRFARGFGSGATLPSGKRMMVVAPALHSETLAQLLVMIDTETLIWMAAPAPAARPGEDIDDPEALFEEACSAQTGSVIRHRKGGVYTRLANVRTAEGDMVLYCSHADGMWWLRPRAMFEDGRFEASSQAPLNLSELGLS